MTNKAQENLYEQATSDFFTTKQLIGLGFNSADITHLVKEGILEKTQIGIYIISTDQLLSYSIKAKDEATPLKSQKILEKCYERDPNNKTICLQLIRIKLLRKDTEDIEKYIPNLYNIENPNQLADANLFLYILNYLTELSPELSQKANQITLDDILLQPGYEKYGIDIFTQNEIRTHLYNHRFAAAKKTYKNIINEIGLYSLKDAAIEQLIYSCSSKSEKLLQRQLKLIETGKIKDLTQLYYKENIRRRLKPQEQLPYYVASDLNNIQQTGRIPYPKYCCDDNLFGLVKTNNYDIALEEHLKYLEEKGIPSERNPLYLLLNEICNEITVINRTRQGELTPEEKIYKKVSETGDIVLLQNLTIDEITKLNQSFEKYRDISIMVIEETKKNKIKKHLVIRKTEYLGDIYIPAIIEKAKEEYEAGNYDESIQLYKKILKSNNPKANSYSGLGYAYMKNGQNKLALDYFIVARYMQKFEKYPYSYDDIIAKLTIKINQQEQQQSISDNHKIYYKSTQNKPF